MPLPKKIPRSGGTGQKQKKDSKDGAVSQKRVLANRYQVEKKLGSGNFGTAFLVKDLKLKNVDDPKDQYKVLKEIPVGELEPDETVDAMHEANLLRNLHHPGIVKFHDSFIDGEFFCLITEYCEGGDLDCKINQYKKQKKTFREEQVVEWLIQLLLAVQYMHSRRVLHRDLKTRNIFLKNNVIKIGDFGISRILMGTTDMASTFTGTPYYMSPEVLKHEGYNSKSDVWSVGCMLYELVGLKHAFEGQSLMGVMYKIVEGDLPDWPKQYSDDLQRVFKKILTKDPAKRPTAADVLKIPFIAKQMELLKNTMIDIHITKEHKDTISMDTKNLANAFNEKTRVAELRQQGEEYKYKNMSPRERMRLRKQEEADKKAKKLHMAARKQLVENKKVCTRLKSTMNETQISSWYDKKAATVQMGQFKYNSDDFHEGNVEEEDDDDIVIGNEGRPYTAPFPNERIDEEYDESGGMGDRFARTADLGTVIPKPFLDDRPITPMKDTMVYSLMNSSLDFDGGIPEDPELANTFYSQYEDFDSDEDSGSDEGTLLAGQNTNTEVGAVLDVMQGFLDKDSNQDDKSLTLKDDTEIGAFGPVARERKINNLRAECERQLGKAEFERAYNYLKKARFGDDTNDKIDDRVIMIGLEKVLLVKKSRDCFLVDQLLFLEAQANLPYH